MERYVSLVDVVCEVLDARIPETSRNPNLEILAFGKPRLMLLNRSDLADPKATDQWESRYSREGKYALACNCRTRKGISGISPALQILGGQKSVVRAMVVGIPNVGKSTLINCLAGGKKAAVSDRPGVTRGNQWIRVNEHLELLDTPGILWPRIDNPQDGEYLAFTGAVKEQILDRQELAAKLLETLQRICPQAVSKRYGVEPEPEEPGWQILEQCARRRGFLLPGGLLDLERMAGTVLDEFQSGKLGRITLEKP